MTTLAEKRFPVTLARIRISSYINLMDVTLLYCYFLVFGKKCTSFVIIMMLLLCYILLVVRCCYYMYITAAGALHQVFGQRYGNFHSFLLTYFTSDLCKELTCFCIVCVNLELEIPFSRRRSK